MGEIRMYGAEWCGDCHRAKRVFDAKDVSFVYVDVDRDEIGLREVRRLNGGRTSGILPTIVFPDGSTLVEPSDPELDDKLSSLRRTSA